MYAKEQRPARFTKYNDAKLMHPSADSSITQKTKNLSKITPTQFSIDASFPPLKPLEPEAIRADVPFHTSRPHQMSKASLPKILRQLGNR